jgi:hypothetical protein
MQKDFDDALSFKQLENGNYEIGIHIGCFLLLKKEPYLMMMKPINATLVYLVDSEFQCYLKYSNFACSLRPQRKKNILFSCF